MNREEKVKVLIVDDHQMSALGTKAMLMPDDTIEVVATAKDGYEAIDILGNHKVDVVLLDILMPKIDGFETLTLMKEKFPEVKVIMLTISEEKETIAKVINLKADGFVFKDVMQDELIKAVHKVFDGDYHYNVRVFDIILHDIINNTGVSKSSKKEPDLPRDINFNPDEIKEKLTSREFEILTMIGKGMSTKEISETLDISKFTVSTYRKNLYTKLKIDSLGKLIDIARSLINN